MAQVEISSGKLAGLDEHGYQAWLGIPFAAAPTGTGRFCPPRAVVPWAGTRDATHYGYACPQGQHPIPGMAASGTRNEDCLFLNVYTPRADGGKRPVMFWIHGGGFRLGSGSELLYHGGPLATRGDVVVVTIHYRLASLGYACFGDASRAWGASANCGQLDQIEALRWVRENIHAFGGDPGNVTIFGESAGSAAVGTLLAMPSAKGLFHKAIMQSGVGRAQPFDVASEFGVKLLAELGARPNDHAAIMGLGVDQIVETTNRIAGDMMGNLGPAIDGTTLPLSPMKANAAGASADIPLLIGTNRDEMKLFNVVPDRKVPEDDRLAQLVAASIGNSEASVVSNLIGSIRDARRAQQLSAGNDDVLDTIQSIARFRDPACEFAAAHAEHQPDTYMYLFTHESPARRGAYGSCHALEIPFVFGTLDAPTQDRFAGTGPEVEALSANMMDAWLYFARTGNPSHEGIGEWHRYDAGSRATMILDANCREEADPLRNEREAVASAMQ